MRPQTRWELIYSWFWFSPAKERRCTGWVQASPKCRASGRPLPVKSQTVPTSPGKDGQQCAQNIANRGSSPKLGCPEFLLGLDHIGLTNSPRCWPESLALWGWADTYKTKLLLKSHCQTVLCDPRTCPWPPGKQKHFDQTVVHQAERLSPGAGGRGRTLGHGKFFTTREMLELCCILQMRKL